MSRAPQTLIAFSGAVECRRDPAGPLGLTLIGRSADGSGEVAHLALMGRAPADMPGGLEGASVEQLATGQYRISSSGRQWVLEAARVFLHRDVSERFYAAVPPRPASWQKRLLWRVALTVAASALGRRWLARRARSSD